MRAGHLSGSPACLGTTQSPMTPKSSAPQAALSQGYSLLSFSSFRGSGYAELKIPTSGQAPQSANAQQQQCEGKGIQSGEEERCF